MNDADGRPGHVRQKKAAGQTGRSLGGQEQVRGEVREDVGLATVYRVLAQFEQADILSRSHFESGKAVYELNEGQHHDHLVCLDCGKVEEFYDAEIEKRQHAVAKAKGFSIADHALSLYATCIKDNCPHRPPSGKNQLP